MALVNNNKVSFKGSNLQVDARFVPTDVRGLQLLNQDDDNPNEQHKIDLREGKTTHTLKRLKCLHTSIADLLS